MLRTFENAETDSDDSDREQEHGKRVPRQHVKTARNDCRDCVDRIHDNAETSGITRGITRRGKI